jgi:hypothetical protein
LDFRLVTRLQLVAAGAKSPEDFQHALISESRPQDSRLVFEIWLIPEGKKPDQNSLVSAYHSPEFR